ncbi:MAG: DUF6065 family protein [Tepidisphaeraceae bacterium]
MLHYFKFRRDLYAPQPARESYVKPGKGRGWPQECPPMRAAGAFGFDVLANFQVTFIRRRGKWIVEPDVVIESDFAYSASDKSEGEPLMQQFAWGWEKGQKLPHVISDHVYEQIRHQMKISTYLFLKTDPNELLLMTDIPNLIRPWRSLTALIETDWYPASYPWHTVIELDPNQKRITIKKGEPLCRLIPVRRDLYTAGPMAREEFDQFFTDGQQWLTKNSRGIHEGIVDIRGRYVRGQKKPKFVVAE